LKNQNQNVFLLSNSFFVKKNLKKTFPKDFQFFLCKKKMNDFLFADEDSGKNCHPQKKNFVRLTMTSFFEGAQILC